MNIKRNIVLNQTACYARMLGAGSLLALAACSDSGSSDQFRTGVFLDSPVAGVSYSTPTTNGLTNLAGEFKYRDGEEVTFTLGSLPLGSATGNSTVTLFDLEGITSPPSNVTEISEQLWGPNSSAASALDRVMNMAMLMQSLDVDNNPANGLEISSEVAAMVTPSNLDLNKKYWEFQQGGNGLDGTGLPGVLRTAASQNLLSARPVKHPGLALDHALNQIGIDIEYMVNTLSISDNDADGTPDRTRTMTYGLTGRLELDEYDNDGDNVVDRRDRYTYGPNLEPLSREFDRDGDGITDTTRTYEYDEFGANTRVLNMTGTTVARDLVMTYDRAGKLVRRENITPSTTVVEIWIVDANGMRSTQEVDDNGDGNIDRRNSLEYGPQTRGDRWLVNNIDSNLDGETDSRVTRGFNAFGQLLFTERDANLDGTPEFAQRYTYDEMGRRTSYDRFPDGVNADYSSRNEYNAAGNNTRIQIDRQGDGIFELDYQYSYNAEGKLTQLVYRDNEVVTGIGAYTYNSDGKPITYEFDTDGNNTIDRISRYTYNAQGQLIRNETDSNNDGTPDQITTSSNYIDLGLTGYF